MQSQGELNTLNQVRVESRVESDLIFEPELHGIGSQGFIWESWIVGVESNNR